MDLQEIVVEDRRSFDLREAVEDLCREILNRGEHPSFPYPIEVNKDKFFVRVSVVQTDSGTEERLEFSRGNLSRIWVPVMDAFDADTKIGQYSILVGLVIFLEMCYESVIED